MAEDSVAEGSAKNGKKRHSSADRSDKPEGTPVNGTSAAASQDELLDGAFYFDVHLLDMGGRHVPCCVRYVTGLIPFKVAIDVKNASS